MYNKDTQPTQKGDKKEQFSEGFTGKYKDEYGKTKLVEFNVTEVAEVEKVENGFKLNIDGLGNKYTQTVNENQAFGDVAGIYDFYLSEGKVVKVKKAQVLSESAKPAIASDKFDKMMRLSNYKPSDYTDTKNSAKY